MSKHEMIRNSRFAACAAIVMGGLALPATAQNPALPRIAAERGFTIATEGQTPMVLQAEPDAACDLHLQGVSDAAHTLRVYANAEGYVRVQMVPSHESEPEIRVQLDCTAGGNLTVYPIHLRVADNATAEMPAPESSIPLPKGSRVLPALNNEDVRQLSDTELIGRGYPARPDAAISPEHYAKWLNLISRPITLLPPHSVSHTGVYHQPAAVAAGTSITAGPATSTNWSGWLVQGGYRKYDNVVGYWHVPFAAGESGHNTNSAFWVGLDGYGNSDLVQAGTESDYADLGGGTGAANYYSWTEVVPNQPEQEVASVNYYDYMEISVFICDDSRNPAADGSNACFDIFNHTQDGAVGVPITTPLGTTKFQGETAEWIMERPCLASCFTSSPGFAELTNYSAVNMDYSSVYDRVTTTWTNPLTVANTQITMYNNGQDYPVNYADNDKLSSVAKLSSTSMQFTWHHFH